MSIRTLWLPLALVGLLCSCENPERTLDPPSDPPFIGVSLSLADLEVQLRASVEHLAGTIGERNLAKPEKLGEAADWIVAQWEAQGLDPKVLTYSIDGKPCRNIEVTVTQHRDGPVILVGAHYDSAEGSPGADDNASGVATMLEISRALAGHDLAYTVRCVAFANEEPPYFGTEDMGSYVYVKLISERGDSIKHMLSIESVGYYRDEPGSQNYPALLSESYPSEGNFLGVVGDPDHGTAVAQVAERLRETEAIPIESAVLPIGLPGVTWSDHASFWEFGFPGVMVTDTAPFRNPNYHRPTDTPASLDYPRFAQATAALIETVRQLAKAPTEEETR
jgi:Zn-dependent M28 family amino/carboxypeptidase